MTPNPTPPKWTIHRSPREAYAIAEGAGSVWLSERGLEVFGVRSVPKEVIDAVRAAWEAR